jgi:diadenosine tetraphosphate (Ap4A) HIT family hydrolase
VREFSVHPKLAADTALVLDWPLCRVLLMNDVRFPWLVLVPRVANASELFELDEQVAQLLLAETRCAARDLKSFAQADKMNIAALGNIVPQLHVHVVARRRDDAAWPGTVWAAGPAEPYPDLNGAAARLRTVL